MIKKHIIMVGGTGEITGKSIVMMYDTMSLFYGNLPDVVSMLYETMDGGGEMLEQLLKICTADKKLNFGDPVTQVAFLKLADKVMERLEKDDEFTLEKTAPEWFRNQLLLTRAELNFNLKNGYGRNMILGRLVSGLALECAKNTEVDNTAGFKAIIDEVVHSSGTYEVRAVFIGSGTGGEGRTSLCSQPAYLKNECIKAVMSTLHMQEAQAKEYVKKILKIGVIMVGAVMRFPVVAGLDQDISGLVSGTLQNYSKENSEAVDAFYLLEHDLAPVQAEKAAEGGPQFKHHHAIELVAYYAAEDFFHMTQKDFDDLTYLDRPYDKVPMIPQYCLPGNARTTWESLSLSEDYRMALSARLRFDAFLFYYLKPQLDLTPDEITAGKIYESEFLNSLYGTKKAKKLAERIAYDELQEKILDPFKILLEREKMFLEWLKDISLTGKDWERDTLPGQELLTDLFPVKYLEEMLSENKTNVENSKMKFCLDRLTDCEIANVYVTNLNLHKVCRDIVYMENKEPREFLAIMRDVYKICADRKERRKWL